MKKMPIDFYYYSGSGNTLLVVNEMTKKFSENGINVTLHKIESSTSIEVNPKRILGLAFPVAFQSTFPFVWKFFRNMPYGNGTPVFMVDTMMAFSGAIVGPLKKVLTQKGYTCIGACEIKMPNNWLPKKVDNTENEKIIHLGLKRAREYAWELIEEKSTWKQIPLLSQTFYHLCCNTFVMNKFILPEGEKITLDTNKCVKCGMCAKLCPVKNITMEPFPKWNHSCQLCMRCINFCPTTAIGFKGKDIAPYRAVKASELLS